MNRTLFSFLCLIFFGFVSWLLMPGIQVEAATPPTTTAASVEPAPAQQTNCYGLQCDGAWEYITEPPEWHITINSVTDGRTETLDPGDCDPCKACKTNVSWQKDGDPATFYWYDDDNTYAWDQATGNSGSVTLKASCGYCAKIMLGSGGPIYRFYCSCPDDQTPNCW